MQYFVSQLSRSSLVRARQLSANNLTFSMRLLPAKRNKQQQIAAFEKFIMQWVGYSKSKAEMNCFYGSQTQLLANTKTNSDVQSRPLTSRIIYRYRYFFFCKRKLIKKKVGSAALKYRCYFSKRECQLPSKFTLYWGGYKSFVAAPNKFNWNWW